MKKLLTLFLLLLLLSSTTLISQIVFASSVMWNQTYGTEKIEVAHWLIETSDKGYAIGGAALGALALFVAYAEETHLLAINLLSTPVVIGLFIGALLPFLFSSLLMLAVGRAMMRSKSPSERER